MTPQTLSGVQVQCVAGIESAITLLIPPNDVADPEISIVVPALNEEVNISEFVSWCHQGLARSGIRGEILIVDSSTDRTAELALAGGARVLKVPKRGLGRAYIDAIPYIRGKYVLMGDADCTYDFRLLAPFVGKFRQGCEYIMGSRFRGSIEAGAMPVLHRYLGTPVTTWILNILYSTRFSDIHCGMRGITRDALVRINLSSQSWEYASEMVLKAVQLRLRIAEVPVAFLKDRNGRVSHHRRMGWFSPWQAAWINLRAMFVYGADFFVLRPGLFMLWTGVLLMLAVMFGPITIGPVTFSLYWMLMGLTLSVLGLQSFYLGCLAQVLNDLTGRARQRWTGFFRYTRSMAWSAAALLFGLGAATPLVREYLRFGLALPHEVPAASHLAIGGLFFLIASFMNFGFTLVIHAATKE
ncbi:MAG TPA: glycosyltransferase [Candidatus Acidoferrales bacterium]|nr:glycosyltransferase [Candidatus Acidoferrales bacterium]